MTNSWIVVLPTVITVILALWTKKIFLSLFIGIFVGQVILVNGNPLLGLAATLDELIEVFVSGWNVKIIVFATLMGGLVALLNYSGGVNGLIKWLEEKASVDDKKSSQIFIWILGVILFFDQVTSEAITATVGQGLADNYDFSREKLAYLVDSTSAPMCAVLPINSWGAYIVGILSTLDVENPMGTLLKTIPFNFYCISALVIGLIVANKDINLGPMKEAEANVKSQKEKLKSNENNNEEKEERISTPLAMIIPLVVLLICVPIFLYITGDGNITSGDASTAVFWGVLVSIISALIITRNLGIEFSKSLKVLKEGTIDMLSVASLLMFAFALSSVCSKLGLGDYIANLTSLYVPHKIVLLLVFITSGLMAFSTGSSWGTFAIMIPIIVPMANAINCPLNLLLASMLSGAIFGDHSSIMSDSTVLASTFSGCDNIEHFRTQLPYTLLSAGIAGILYLIVGAILL